MDALLWVDDHAKRLAWGWDEANGELWVVAVDGFHTDQHGITISSQFVDLLKAASGRESLGCLRPVVHRTVGIQRQFDRDQRTTVLAPVHEGPHLFVSIRFHQADTCWNAGLFEHPASVASHGRVGVVMGDDDFADTSPHERFRAGRCASEMVARLQGHVSGRAVGRMPLFFCIMDGHLFGVQSTQMVVPSFGDDHAVLDEHTPHQGVWADLAAAAFSHQQRVFHEHAVVLAPISAHAWPTLHLFMTACMGSSILWTRGGECMRNE